MDPLIIIATVGKGIAIAQALLEAGQSAEPILASLFALITGHQQGTVTPADVVATEALLDKQIADFNLDLPPAAP